MAKPKASILLFVIVLLTAVAAAAFFYMGRNEERTKRIWTEGQLRQMTEAKEALAQEKEELTKARQALEEQLGDLTQQAKTLSDQLAQEKRARETLTSQIAQTQRESNQFKGQLDAERKEKLTLTEDLAKAKQSYQALSNELTTLRQAKEALEKRVKEMLAARAKEAEQIVVKPGAGPASSSSPAGTAGRQALAGKVLVVNREFNFVVINLGSKDGIKAGSRFAVLKGDRQIGTVEVERLYDNLCAANVLVEEKKGQLQEGNAVRLIS